ncbi:MAG: PAS domain-containing sensor histidine kinase [Bacillota bacterium]
MTDDSFLNYKERCKTVFEKAPLAIIITDRQNNIIDWNIKAQDIFGWTKEEAINQSLNIIIPKEDYADNTERIEKIFSGVKMENSLIKNITKDGKKIYCEWNTEMIADDENNLIEIISIISDKTENLEVEEKIKIQKEEIEYNQLRTQFFANISHELKTPLNLIFSSLQLIDFHFKKGNLQEKKDKIYKYLSSIKINGYRLLRLVNNVIDITRIDVDSFNLSRGNFDIVKFFEAVVDSIDDYIQEKDRNFSYVFDIDKAVIAFDPFNIERVILNLISNAVKCTNPGDNITLKLSREAEEIIISVIDTGIGIEEENYEVIFDQFRQVDQSFKKKREGSGIGLYLVKSIVEMHGGRVKLESNLGEYTEFKIYLPDKIIDKDTVEQESYSPASLLDKIEIEFSDIYNL